ncbi:MAG: hypothetical protein KTR22_10335 [Flavobacteriaceae bacterium]|nr:hypothetical protein [Flavobacteriaceae bacterium]
MIKKLSILILTVVVLACQGNPDSQNKNVDIAHKLYTLEDAGWRSKRVAHLTGDIQYRATQVPVEYYLLRSLGGDRDSLASLSGTMAGERIVEVEFEHFGKGDLLEERHTGLDYDRSVSYMAQGLSGDFTAVTATGDTIPCSGVHFERHFKVSPFKRVILYFGGVPEGEGIQLIYNDRLFGNGIFKFTFEERPFKT